VILRGPELVGDGKGPQDISISGPSIGRIGRYERSRDDVLVEFDGAIAFPALINSHDHLEFNLYPLLGHKKYSDYLEWGDDIHRRDRDLISSMQRVPKTLRLRWGALKNIVCGVTTVAHHGAMADDIGTLLVRTVPGTSIHSVGAVPHWRLRLNAPFGREPYVVHIGEGTSTRAQREIQTLLRWNVFRKPLVGVHAIAMTPLQAERFRALVWCPVSNEFLYGATADIAALKRRTTILFGTDATLTGDWNIWNHLRYARACNVLEDRELFDAITSRAAAFWRLPGLGRLAAGQVADVVIARKKTADPWEAFFAIDPEDILLVLRSGSVVLCDTSIGDVRIPRPCSLLRVGASSKLIADDALGTVGSLRGYGVEPNLPITVDVCPQSPHSSRI
jgi:cytosine/adenosine deaminase-related metal-dependent hydrolase